MANEFRVVILRFYSPLCKVCFGHWPYQAGAIGTKGQNLQVPTWEAE